jgi:hypothetical protein
MEMKKPKCTTQPRRWTSNSTQTDRMISRSDLKVAEIDETERGRVIMTKLA